jgi:hypothetical protein
MIKSSTDNQKVTEAHLTGRKVTDYLKTRRLQKLT